MGTKTHNNYEDLITFTRASAGHALRPVSYGAELVTNGTFDTDISGWVNGAASFTTLSYDAGTLEISALGGNARANQGPISVEIGKLYLLSVEVTQKTLNSSSFLHLGTSLGGADIKANLTKNNPVGVDTFSFVATTNEVYIQLGAIAGATVNYDNVSVKEVTFDESDGTLTLFEHPDNIPRVEYDADGNRLGLLVEEARTNLVTYSEDFTDSSWAKSGAGTGSAPTVTANYATAPDGTLTASRFVANSGSGTTSSDYSLMRFTVSSAPSTLTNSLWIKSNTGSNQTVKISYGASDAVHTVTPEWQNFNIISGNPSFADVVVRGDQTDASVDLLIWGYQAEAGSFPTSYIKTTGSTATRSADVASIPVADFGFNTAVGSVVVTGRSYEPGTDNYFFEMSKDSSNRNIVKCANSQHLIVNFGGVTQANLDAGAIAANTEAKLAVSIQTDNFGASLDGGAVVTDTSGTAELDVSEFRIGSNRTGGEILNGHIKSIKYYPRRLTNAQLQDITS